MYIYSVLLLRFANAYHPSERLVSTAASHPQQRQAAGSSSVELPLGLELLPRQASDRLPV